MKLLEALYATEFKPKRFYQRKVSINSDKTIIFGPPNSGKTALLLDHISKEKKGNFLYIDFNDLRLDQAIFLGLPNFIKKNSISLLVLDNFDFSFTIPESQRVLISTDINKELNGFERQILYPLDFEEFIAFEKRDFEIESIFNSFASTGTYPHIVNTPKDNFIKEFQKLIISQMDSKLELIIFKAFALLQGEILSPYSIYNDIKIFHKLSKDKFYEILNKFKTKKLLLFLEKYQKPRADKKVYLIDFAIKSVLTYDKDFIKRFENIIFLELIKSGEEFYYTDMIEFFLPQKELAIKPILFTTLPMIKNKLDRIKKELFDLNIKRVEVITLEASGEFEVDGIECEVVAFWEWALRR